MRREGRRPALPLAGNSTGGGEWDLPGSQRPASSIARSGERKSTQERGAGRSDRRTDAPLEAARRLGKDQMRRAVVRGGLPNKEAAKQLNISEQAVANYKFDFLARLRTLVKQSGLPAEVFPELQEK